jgi:hypothetical protein
MFSLSFFPSLGFPFASSLAASIRLSLCHHSIWSFNMKFLLISENHFSDPLIGLGRGEKRRRKVVEWDKSKQKVNFHNISKIFFDTWSFILLWVFCSWLPPSLSLSLPYGLLFDVCFCLFSLCFFSLLFFSCLVSPSGFLCSHFILLSMKMK